MACTPSSRRLPDGARTFQNLLAFQLGVAASPEDSSPEELRASRAHGRVFEKFGAEVLRREK